MSFLLFGEWADTHITVTYVSSHFAERDMCPNVLPCAEACPKCPSVCEGLIRKEIWAQVPFGKMTRHVSAFNLTVGDISSKRKGIYLGHLFGHLSFLTKWPDSQSTVTYVSRLSDIEGSL